MVATEKDKMEDACSFLEYLRAHILFSVLGKYKLF